MESKKECYIFPTYAKRHYLDAGRERLAIHVNVHGWIFTPAIPGASRRNKYTMLLARSLAGLPALPDPRRANSDPLDEMPASPRVSLSRSAGRWFRRESSDSDSDQNVPDMSPSQPMFAAPPRADTDASLDSTTATSSRLDQLSEMDLRICHDNLNLRMGPFLARPEIGKLVKLRLRIGTYESVHTLRTLDNGHFKSRIALPLDAQHHGEDKVEVSIVDDAEMSASEEVSIIGDQGITVISDMDDTIKHTGITEGVRAAFRNAFVREHEHLEVEGVRQWYKSLKEAGCALSYVSNAPWQLWPSLAKFLEVAQLPTGSVTLKEYSGGMLQSIWEPAAEKKRANVQKIMEEFPQRKFLLIGDSGEQDIELYTELASSGFAKQILGIFIRDVSSMGQGPSATGLSGENFFTAGALDDKIDVRTSQEMQPPQLPQRKTANLIDLSDDTITTPSTSEHMQDLLSLDDSKSSAKQTCETPAVNKKVKPALPPKPSALKRASRDVKPESTEAEEARPSHRPELRRDASSISLLSGLTDRTRKAGAGVLTYYGERRKDEQVRRNATWQKRIESSRAMLPPHIKLYIWKTGTDAEHHAAELIRKAKRQFATS
jgi:phosphatidate phosphatase APP1